MPLAMTDVQSVVVNGKLYVGGGNDKVMEYDTSFGTWTKLPHYEQKHFAMTGVNNQLVVVGGRRDDTPSKKVGVWRTDRKVWTHPYPEMPTARFFCAAVSQNGWLVVMGGKRTRTAHLTAVEILNTATNEWFAGPPLPVPVSQMKISCDGNMCYLMGGFANNHESNVVYGTSIKALTLYIKSQRKPEMWLEIPGTQLFWSTPLAVNGSLFAVGGSHKGKGQDSKSTTAVHLYQPASGGWVKVGDLPFPRHNCTCAVTQHGELFVAGGFCEDPLKGVDISSFYV
jgi:N-acetylneuraminic acid mutarotase